MAGKIAPKVLLVSIAAALLLAGYLYRSRSSSASAQLQGCSGCNLVVVMIDTLRADHLSGYGYRRETSPFISSIMQRSAVFKRAYSTSSWTAPATASFFTSELPSQHGVITGFAATKRMQRQGRNIDLNKLPADRATLGEFMKSAGFFTVGVADNLNIGSEMGFDRGFELFEKFYYRGAEVVAEQVDQFMQKAPKSDPYFLYIHFMDPHHPYNKREPFYSECLAGSEGSNQGETVCRYDSEIRYVDEVLQKMAERYGWLENSVIVLTSDHGEEFWDHGGTGHGDTLYREMIHVPFIIYHPHFPARSIDVNVGHIDMLPTLAALLDMPAHKSWQGRSLKPLLNGGSFDSERILFSERLRSRNEKKKKWRRSGVRREMHYIKTAKGRDTVFQELFDLNQDFSEQKNIFTSDTKVGAVLSERVAALPMPEENNESGKVEVEVDSETYEQLKTLGYLD
ncbi:MAG: sulfatase [Deltaproteobacteria bacterium]|nr:sulfatase [Deltaproteobacteria bacterium]